MGQIFNLKHNFVLKNIHAPFLWATMCQVLIPLPNTNGPNVVFHLTSPYDRSVNIVTDWVF